MNSNDKARLELEALDRAENAEQRGKPQAWQRQPGESAKAYAAFAKYRDLSTARTMAKVAEMSGCSSQNIERWARRWAWTHRAAQFDMIEEETFREQASRDRLAHRRRQIQIGQALQSVAVAGLRELQGKLEQKLPLGLAPDQIAILLKLGDQMESAGLGEGEGASRFTKIVVNLLDAEPIDDAPTISSAAVLCDDTTGEGVAEGDKKPN